MNAIESVHNGVIHLSIGVLKLQVLIIISNKGYVELVISIRFFLCGS